MSWIEKALKKVLHNEPPPQYADIETNEFEVLEGKKGASKHILWSEDNEALFTTSKPGVMDINNETAGIATESTLSTQLDITLTALRDAIVGSGADATTQKQILDKAEEIRVLLTGTLTVDSSVQNWPSKQEVNLSQTGTDNKVDVDFPSSQTVDGAVDVTDKVARELGKVTAEVTGSNVVNADVQNVNTAGARAQLPSIACREITIIGLRANTGYIYVGGSDVSDTVYGAELAALDSITIAVENANMLYIDASVSGEGVSYVTV